MTEPAFTTVVAAAKIEEKSFATFDVNGIALLVYRFRDEFFAVENLCSHAQASFDEARIRGYQLTCPVHGATFDIRDGSATGKPARKPIRAFALRIVNGMIEVALDSA